MNLIFYLLINVSKENLTRKLFYQCALKNNLIHFLLILVFIPNFERSAHKNSPPVIMRKQFPHIQRKQRLAEDQMRKSEIYDTH